MLNFRIGTQIEKEIEDFLTAKVKLASTTQDDQLVRYAASNNEAGYYYNQNDAVNIIDLYYNSKFESGPRGRDRLRKIFLNIGKFRTEVAAMQTDIDTKDGRFIPDDYADPWTAIFLQKDFKEWAKDTDFGELLNKCVDNFPKYGTVVLKKVGKEIKWTPLQNLKNEQTADSLQTAKYVIEEHPDMTKWEMEKYPTWNLEGLALRFDQTMTVYERYGYVPLRWLKEANGIQANEKDELIYVDALVICGKVPGGAKKENSQWHVFFAERISERPYREAHWNKQHGRWLGLGVMEDLIENQEAKNLVVNYQLKRIRWGSKVIGQSRDTNATMKNLATEVKDGEVIEVGPEGQISILDFSNRSNVEFQNFLAEWEKNADQKAFSYEVATGENMPSGTPFRLGVVLSGPVNRYFTKKRENLGLFLEKVVCDFLVPQFLRDMSNKEKVLNMFCNEAGYEILLEAAKNMIREEATKVALLSGQPIDALSLQQAVEPFEEIKVLFFKRPAKYYQNAKYKFTFQFTGEAVDLESKLETLKSLYTLLAQRGDPRAEKVLARISALGGECLAQFGSNQLPANPMVKGMNPSEPTATPAMMPQMANGQGTPATV